MKLALRYCQHCSRRALTARSRYGMRDGWIYRKNHDLCARCFRVAKAAALREWPLVEPGARLGPRPAPREKKEEAA